MEWGPRMSPTNPATSTGTCFVALALPHDEAHDAAHDEEENQRRGASRRHQFLPAARTPRLLLPSAGDLPQQLMMRAVAAT